MDDDNIIDATPYLGPDVGPVEFVEQGPPMNDVEFLSILHDLNAGLSPTTAEYIRYGEDLVNQRVADEQLILELRAERDRLRSILARIIEAVGTLGEGT